MPPPTFIRRAWEKYPIYYTDEEHDNLDDDPREKRNTSQTLAEELAICEKREFAANSRQKPSASIPSEVPADPQKRIKARIGKRFLRGGNTATAVGSTAHGNHGSSGGLGERANAGVQQNGSSNDALQNSSQGGSKIQFDP